ncbi:hypothetical protein K492DRAFT_175883, partial [Lichtheimia hyalospora FSU 10163]
MGRNNKRHDRSDGTSVIDIRRMIILLTNIQSIIQAMKGFEDCYKCLKVTNKKHRDLSITIMVVDKCAACRVG